MGGQSCLLCQKPIEPGQHVTLQHGILLHLRCYSLERLAKKAGTPRVRCAVCQAAVAPDANTVIRADGSIVHNQCPEPLPEEPARPIAGGCSVSS